MLKYITSKGKYKGHWSLLALGHLFLAFQTLPFDRKTTPALLCFKKCYFGSCDGMVMCMHIHFPNQTPDFGPEGLKLNVQELFY